MKFKIFFIKIFSFEQKEKFQQNPAIWSPIPLSDTFLASQKMDEIGAEFGRLFKNNEQKVFRKLPKEQKYTKMFTKCYDRIFYGNDKQVDACPGENLFLKIYNN